VVEYVLDAGGKPMVGDNPGVGGYGRTEHAAAVSGILEASLGHFVNFAKDPVRKKLDSRYFSEVAVSRCLLDADLVISVPKFKTHALTLITCGIKNMFGMVVGADKSKVHSRATTPDKFSEAIVDIYRIRPPDFTVCDAVVGMEGNGPTGAPLRKIGRIIGARNAVQLDAVAVGMMGVEPRKVHLLKYAAGLGLGGITVDDILVTGDASPIPGFKLPLSHRFTFATGFGTAIGNRFLFERFTRPKLVLLEPKCTKCGICAEHCPSGAMKFTKGAFPKIDPEKCIMCFCCSELCETNAWELQGFLKRFQSMRMRRQ
jgi:uncharacterized protein (DUF362 family)/NAD-dependent dihydropyrimidine dehydrogenase PreA subunit